MSENPDIIQNIKGASVTGDEPSGDDQGNPKAVGGERAATLESLEERRKKVEEENRRKKRVLAKAIAER